MADFEKIVDNGKRLCTNYIKFNCLNCPLYFTLKDGTTSCSLDMLFVDEDDYGLTEKVEQIILKWLEKNPEPCYPTWVEWLKNFGPNNYEDEFRPCVFDQQLKDICNSSFCDRCRNLKIPKKIAKKLGIDFRSYNNG